MKDDRLVEMRVFRAVADAGGFTAAAHALGVSQPFVSRAINSLERRLGVALIHRTTRGQRLTEEGLRYLASSRRIIDEIEEAEAQLQHDRARPQGDLRVSAPLAFGMDQIGPRLPAFLERYPDVKLHFSLSDTLANLIEGNVDVAIRMGKLQDSSLMSRKLCNLQRVVVASPKYIARHGRPVTPEELTEHNCLMWQKPMDHLNRWPFLIKEELKEFSVRGNFQSSNGLTLTQLCADGVGIMRMAEHVALPAISEGKLKLLLADFQAPDDTAIHAVFLPERELLPRIRVFVDYLVDVFVSPPWYKQ